MRPPPIFKPRIPAKAENGKQCLGRRLFTALFALENGRNHVLVGPSEAIGFEHGEHGGSLLGVELRRAPEQNAIGYFLDHQFFVLGGQSRRSSPTLARMTCPLAETTDVNARSQTFSTLA